MSSPAGDPPPADPPAEHPPPPLPAGVVTRVLAAGVDVGAVALLTAVVYLGVTAVQFAWLPLSFTWPRPAGPVSVAVVLVIAVVYLAVAWATTGRTYGGVLLGVRVVSTRHALLGWNRATLRALACVVLPIGLLWVAISPRRRSVQDLLLRSVVVYDWHLDGGARVMKRPGPPSAPAP